ncbi:hypothetical protein ES288_A12G063000v1 [Gossypium darwinii]|uniref:RNase H type-1 domain-containing protein n=1 Tax=Gossypium darwinii TaxID=34276 RepID=A0A5D2E677_GOSDA|nr:hypothetical protein ES288_A12G063000v1 [Gossypium darwinii]
MRGSATCSRCQDGVEIREHVFHKCSVAKETWEYLNIKWILSEESTDFREWFKCIFESRSKAICRIFACTLWALWTSRNRFIHDGEIKTGAQIAIFVENHIKELDGLKQNVPVERFYVASWVASEGTGIKINFNAAFNNRRKESCSGLVILMNSNIPSVFAAEVVACFQALQLGLQPDMREVEIEGDS